MNKSERNYDTLSEATADLNKRGYKEDFIIKTDGLECRSDASFFKPSELMINEVYRFEGLTNPGDNSVVYAVSSNNGNCKGIIIDAYGAYANPDLDKLIKKIEFEEN